MATIKNIYRAPNWGVRPTDNTVVLNHVWYVKEGECYDLIQFTINELKKPYFWRNSLCVPVKWSDKRVRKTVEDFCKQITDKDIWEFGKFLEEGETWGWN